MTAADRTDASFKSERRIPLLNQLRRAERSRKIWAFALTVPLFLFLLITFAIPIAQVLSQGVRNGEMTQVMPGLAAELGSWNGQGMPPVRVVEAFVQDVAVARDNQTLSRVATRLNFSVSGYRGLLLRTARQLPSPDNPDLLQALIEIDGRWGERRYWTVMKQASPEFTLEYLLTTVDRQFDADGEIVRRPPETSLYVTVLMRTLWISISVTLICVIIGYPMAYLLATLPTKYSNILLLLLLLPFWTSLLVRTTAWLVLLQNQGVVNDAGIWLGLWDQPLQLIRNRLGVYIAMVHILLPFMVLPIYSVMKGISPFHMKAAASLGARPVRSFLKVYAPQTIAGVGAGSLLVFIITLGFYITPALVGGPGDQMLSYFIAFSANSTVNWGLAAALSLMLMLCVGVFFALYSRLVGVRTLGAGR